MISLSDIRKEFREPGGQVRVIFDGMDFAVGGEAAAGGAASAAGREVAAAASKEVAAAASKEVALASRGDAASSVGSGAASSAGRGATSVAVLGRSGSGKTTLLRILAGLDIDYKGGYKHDGKTLAKTDVAMAAFRRQTIGYISQHYDLLEDRNVAANIALALSSGGRKERAAKTTRVLEMVGLGGFEKKRVRQLSGGEAQRVAIARALAKDASIILADEPTGALDEATEDDILDLFDDLQERDVTFVIATHSPKVAARCARRLEIQHKRLVEA